MVMQTEGNETPGGFESTGVKPVTAEVLRQRSAYARVSGKVVEDFRKANVEIAEIDAEFYGKPQQNLRMMLTQYVKSHNLAIAVFVSGRKLYLQHEVWPIPEETDTSVSAPQHTLKTA